MGFPKLSYDSIVNKYIVTANDENAGVVERCRARDALSRVYINISEEDPKYEENPNMKELLQTINKVNELHPVKRFFAGLAATIADIFTFGWSLDSNASKSLALEFKVTKGLAQDVLFPEDVLRVSPFSQDEEGRDIEEEEVSEAVRDKKIEAWIDHEIRVQGEKREVIPDQSIAEDFSSGPDFDSVSERDPNEF